MDLKTAVLGIIVLAVLFVSIVAVTTWWLISVNSNSEFFVGVEFAYSGNVSDVKSLVDKVKDYTNLFVIGSIEISFNQTALNEACDYVVNSGLYLIVFLTDSQEYHYANNYTIFNWGAEAKKKYGDMLLGVYRYDEPGGNQLDLGPTILIKSATDYTDAAKKYTTALNILLSYHNYVDTLITSDYGLYWFDYKAGYTAVLTELGWNHSRPLHIALCRGAAEAYNRDWGAIVTWTYNVTPFIYSGEELYSDLKLAYNNGAKYAVVFDYPVTGTYGILADEHFEKLEEFWSYVQSNPQEHGVFQGEVAYVLPKDYGFGFRSAEDKIWGLWEADELSEKVWDDVNTLVDQYSYRLDIVYSDPEVISAFERRYEKLFFWNETITK